MLLLLAVYGQVQAQDLKTVYYQGVLLDPAGEALPDGLYSLTFAFYDSATGGNQLWSEEQQVYVEGGEFIAQLGEIHPLNLSFEKSSWLVVALKGEENTSERTEFLIPSATLDSE